MRLTLTDRHGRKIAEFEVVHQGESDKYSHKDYVPRTDEPQFELANAAARTALAKAIAAPLARDHKQRTCAHDEEKPVGSSPNGSFTVHYFECLKCGRVRDDD